MRKKPPEIFLVLLFALVILVLPAYTLCSDLSELSLFVADRALETLDQDDQPTDSDSTSRAFVSSDSIFCCSSGALLSQVNSVSFIETPPSPQKSFALRC